MSRIEKTVFISYRRTNAPWALAIYQYLNYHGYDAFIDFQGIASGALSESSWKTSAPGRIFSSCSRPRRSNTAAIAATG